VTDPAPIARVNAYRTAVVATIRAAMPDLRECEEQFGRFNLDELETISVRCPAVRVAVLEARAMPMPNGQVAARLSCAAFAISEGRDRDAAAWTMAEAIAVLLQPAQLFGLTRLGAPEALRIQPIITARVKARGVAIIAVEWTQELRELGTAIFDDDGVLLEELYVNDELVDLDDGEEAGP
jgi:hypothetical protein